MRHTFLLLSLASAISLAGPALAAEVSAAAAANFTRPAEALGRAFTARTGHTVIFSFGATGQLYSQLSQGAPFEVFLAADDTRPARAVDEGIGVAGTAFTYAIGQLVLYSPEFEMADGAAVLASNGFHHLALADPRTAPYGAAAMETIAALGLTETLGPRLVTGENISQVLQFVDSGNAELGFVALSQVIDRPAAQQWRVPAAFHAPIRQDAVLTRKGEASPAARDFLDFLRSAEGRAIIAGFGYEVP